MFRWAVRLTWFLMHSPAMLPIPGTSSVEHLEENFVPASAPRLTDRRITALDLSGEQTEREHRRERREARATGRARR